MKNFGGVGWKEPSRQVGTSLCSAWAWSSGLSLVVVLAVMAGVRKGKSSKGKGKFGDIGLLIDTAMGGSAIRIIDD